MLGLELSLHINALLEEDTFQQGVLVSQHETFVCRRAMSGIEVGERLLLHTYRLLELLDVFGAPLTERRLSLPVSLLPLLRCRVYLSHRQSSRSHTTPDMRPSRRGLGLWLPVLTTLASTQTCANKGAATYRLTSSLPLGRLLGRGVGLAAAVVARLGYISFSVQTLGAHGRLLAILSDRIFLVIGGRLV